MVFPGEEGDVGLFRQGDDEWVECVLDEDDNELTDPVVHRSLDEYLEKLGAMRDGD